MTRFGILLLMREEELGIRCADLLKEMGFPCGRMPVHEGSTMALVLDWVAREQPGLVLCEFEMPPLSAFEVLRALRVFGGRVAVAALAHDRLGANEFLWEGGAAHVIRQLGALPQELDEVLRQVEAYRRRQGGIRNRVVDFLATLNDEAEFRRFAIRLFHGLDYRDVHATHGIGESGKDIVFFEENHLGEREYVGVQAKIGDIHASVSKRGNVTELWLQTLEAFNCPVLDLGEEHFLDKVVLLTAGEFTEPARTKLRGLLRPTKYDKRIYMWGRDKIADLVATYVPRLDFSAIEAPHR
jgi:hypothetical protein